MKTVCITGGAGFIGSNLVRRCLELGYEVKVIDDFSTGRFANLADIDSEIELVEADIRETDEIKPVLKQCELIFHQAAMPSVPRSMADPSRTTDITLMGTVKLLETAVEAGVERVVYASSSSIYGNQPGFPRSEDMSPQPESPYAASKASCELFGRVFANNFPIETVGLRYFNVFGPRQDPDSDYAAVVPSFISSLLTASQPVIYGDGEQSRDFTYVEDVVEANIIAGEKGKNGRVYNVAYNDRTSVNQLFTMIKEITNSDIEPRYDPPRSGDVRCSFGDDRLFKKETGFQPAYSVKEGLEKTVEWYRNNEI
ncbi:MAG: SDR family oxidoreductase [bacterium]